MEKTKIPNFYHRWAYIDEILTSIECIPSMESNKNLSAQAQTQKNFFLQILNDFNMLSLIKRIRALSWIEGIAEEIIHSFFHKQHAAYIDTMRQSQWIHSLSEVLYAWHEIFHLFILADCAQFRKNITSAAEINLSTQIGAIKTNFPARVKQFTDSFLAKNAQKRMLMAWHRLHQSAIQNYVFESTGEILTKRDYKHFLVKSTDIKRIIRDTYLDPIKQQFQHVEPFFRGVHQILEISLCIMLKRLKTLEINLTNFNYETHVMSQTNNAMLLLRHELYLQKQWWEVASKHIMLLNKMDAATYSLYRQALLGTSGGDSLQLRLAKHSVNNLHIPLIKNKNLDDLLNILRIDSTNPLLNQLLNDIRELQAAANNFWLMHFTLAANTIGMIKGSQGLPVEKLLSFAVAPLTKADSLLKFIGKLGEQDAKYPQAQCIVVNGQSKIIGNSIFAHLKNEYHAEPYQFAEIVQNPLLDSCELKPLSLEDNTESPYAAWFDPSLHAHGIHFSMHSYGQPLILCNESLQSTTQRLTTLQNNYWDVYFNERLPQFLQLLGVLLNFNDAEFAVAIDNNATTLLERLLSSFPHNRNSTTSNLKNSFIKNSIIMTTDQEFLTVKRTLAALKLQYPLKVQAVSINPNAECIADNFVQAIKSAVNTLQLIIFSHTFSNTQACFNLTELEAILDAVPSHIPIIIDIVQSAFNVPMNWGELLKHRHNVYLLGSGIKHGRSTGGLGFLIYPQTGILSNPLKSGWCAYLSGLSNGEVADANGELLYDKPYMWWGGTPGNFFALELFINTWDAILRTGQSLTAMHQYVQRLVTHFTNRLGEWNLTLVDARRRQLHAPYASNAVAFRVDDQKRKEIMKFACSHHIYFDERNDLLRIGFGIQHGEAELAKLCDVLNLKISSRPLVCTN